MPQYAVDANLFLFNILADSNVERSQYFYLNKLSFDCHSAINHGRSAFRVLALSSLMIISACSQMTDEEWKAFRCREWIKREQKPHDEYMAILIRKAPHHLSKSEVKEMCDSVLKHQIVFIEVGFDLSLVVGF